MYPDFAYFLEEYFTSSAFIVNLILNSFSSLFGIALYVLSSLGFYTMAKRRGINRPWLAWIPLVRIWLVGCISDQYRYVVKGQEKNKRKSLLTLRIVVELMRIAILVFCVILIVNCIDVAMNNLGGNALMEAMLVPFIVMMALLLVCAGVSVAYSVIYYMAMYDIYTSCNPEYNVLFLVLSIVFSVTEGFFVFFNKNKDKGMPPRKVEQIEA